MAARTATKSGNWSDVSVWDGGASLPGSGDTADSNGYTVTIDQSIDLSPGGALIGTNAGAGGFVPGAHITIKAAITGSVRQVLATGGGWNVSIIGDISGTVLTLNRASGSGTVSITGNITTGFAGGTVSNGTVGIMNITGNITGGATGSPYTGAVTNGASGTLNITGDVTGGTATAAYGVSNTSTGTVNLTGNATGGSGAIAYGIYNGSGTVNVSNAATGGGDRAYGVLNAATGTVNVGIAQGGTNKDSAGIYGENASGTTTYGIAIHSATTSFPLKGFCKLAYTQASSYIRVIRSDTGATVDLSNDYPAAADVKSGTVYKLGGLTGTLAGGGGFPILGGSVVR